MPGPREAYNRRYRRRYCAVPARSPMLAAGGFPMKKAFLVSMLCAVAATAVLAQQTAPPPMPASPRGTAATQVGGKWVEAKPGDAPRYREGKWIVVDYGRPILRDRKDIFGTAA